MTIRRVEPLSCAKIGGLVYAAIGLLIGALCSCFALLSLAFSGVQRELAQNALSPLIGAMIGAGAIIVLPIIYGVIGFVTALIGAWLYNLIASKVGGIQIDVV